MSFIGVYRKMLDFACWSFVLGAAIFIAAAFKYGFPEVDENGAITLQYWDRWATVVSGSLFGATAAFCVAYREIRRRDVY